MNCLIFIWVVLRWEYMCESADVDLRCTSLLRWGRGAREFEEHWHWVKINKHSKTVSFFFIITGEMEKLYGHTTETQRTNQKVSYIADLRTNILKTRGCPAASTSCSVYLFAVRLVSKSGSAQGPMHGRAGSNAALPLPALAKFSRLSWDSCTIETVCCMFWHTR